MTRVSTAKKIALAVRVLAQQAEHSRIGGALLSGARATAASVGKVLHVLWLEGTGFIFLCLGAIGAAAGAREFYKPEAGAPHFNKVLGAGLVGGLFCHFGVFSVWRAPKKRGWGG